MHLMHEIKLHLFQANSQLSMYRFLQKSVAMQLNYEASEWIQTQTDLTHSTVILPQRFTGFIPRKAKIHSWCAT